MNIAICISGHARDYKKFSKSFFEKIIEPNSHHNIDIFISTWDRVNNSSSFASVRRRYEDDSSLNINEIKEIYKPKLMIVEEETSFIFEKYNNTNHSNNPKNVISQFYKINQVSNLLRTYIESTNTKYDLVFKTRFDVNYGPSLEQDFIDGKSDLTLIDFKFENFDLNYFNVEHDWNHYRNWIHDKIFVSNVENYLSFADIYKNFDYIVNKIGTPVAEHVIYEYLINEKNIPVKKVFDLRVLGWQNT